MRKSAETDPKNFQATLLLGKIALLANRLGDAQNWLSEAIALKPEDTQSKSLLAEVFNRRGDFQRAAPLLRMSGKEVGAKKMESFHGGMPYQIEGKSNVTRLRFIRTDPLPVVQLKINDSENVNFIVDTGGSELIIDSEFANRVHATQFDAEAGTFAGGKQSAHQHGRVESLTLGDFKVRSVPVLILDTRRYSAVAGGRRVDGILGTCLLYRFLSTLDYPQGELILERKKKENANRVARKIASGEYVASPFWLAGDHYVLAQGSVNGRPILMFIDTGLAGLGFTCPESTLAEAGIKLEGQAIEGAGGGGRVQVKPFQVAELTLGGAKEKNISGVFGAFPPSLENTFGFGIGGLISHSFLRPYAMTLDFTNMRLVLKQKQP